MRRFILLLGLLLTVSAIAERGTPTITSTPRRSAVIRCAGDFVIHDSLIAAAKRAGGGSPDFSEMLTAVNLYLADANFTVTNVDGVMGDEAFVKKHGYAGYPSFSTPATLLDALKGCGVDMLTLSNNHALDFWFSGLKSTVSTVEAAGLLSVGGYRTQAERKTPRIVEINGIKVGFLNYTDSLNGMESRKELDKDSLKYGLCFTPYVSYKSDVRALKEAGAEAVICFMHWGTEYRTEPNNSQVNTARLLCEAGVDVIIGSHPHVVQKISWINAVDQFGVDRETLCVYSLGNFLSGQRTEGTDCGIIFSFTLACAQNGSIYVSEYSYEPVWVWMTESAQGSDFTVLMSREYLTGRPSGMPDAHLNRLRASVSEIQNVMGELHWRKNSG